MLNPSKPRLSRSGVRLRCACLVAGVLCAGLTGSAPAAAQQGWEPTGTTGEVAFLGLNTLAGAVTAGLSARLRGGDFAEAAVRGAIGGAVVYGGKRLVVTDVPAAGLLGRQVGAAGTSMVRNAGEGRPVLERLTLPLALVRLDVNVPATRVEAARINLSELAVLAWVASRAETSVDWRATLAGGAPVFDAPEHFFRVGGRNAGGVMANGTVLVSRVAGSHHEAILRHEHVHVVQHDFTCATIGAPLESWLARRIPLGERFARYFETGLPGLAFGLIAYHAHEAEAEFLQHR